MFSRQNVCCKRTNNKKFSEDKDHQKRMNETEKNREERFSSPGQIFFFLCFVKPSASRKT